MKKLYITDLDGTLLNQNASISPYSEQVIKKIIKQGIHFTPDEITLILDIIKEGKTPEEKAQIDSTIQMVKTVLSKNLHS